MVILKSLFNIFKYPILSFQFISHRILRWTLSPLCIVLLFISNALIVIRNGNLFYTIFFLLQLAFYLLAVIGWRYAHKNITVKALYLPYYFLFMNVSVYMGFYKFIRKKQQAIWEKANRKDSYNTTKWVFFLWIIYTILQTKNAEKIIDYLVCKKILLFLSRQFIA